MTLLRLTLNACVLVALTLLAISDGGAVSAESRRTDHAPGVLRIGELRQKTAAEQLVAKYAPILYLGRQDQGCDSDGDPFDPAPVEIVLDNPEVTLRKDVPGRPVVMEGPGAQDVFDKGEEFYIDWPGNPRNPGCTYEQDYRVLTGDDAPVIYAHIAKEPGFEGLAVQYLFFYYFNDFLNKHEGDWEMIQVAFDTDSVTEALAQEPARLAYSGHGGGEKASWEDDKVQKEDGRPVVYVARGSHASYYEPGVYLGTAKEGAVFGCERTTEPHRRVDDAEVQLLPNAVSDPEDEFAWIEYDGLWGEQDKNKIFAGVQGPKQKSQWEKPFTWENNLRDFSDKLPDAEGLGFDPLAPFCFLVGIGSSILIQIEQNPLLVGVITALAIGTSVGVLMVGVPRKVFGLPSHTAAETYRGKLELRRPRGLGQIGRAATVVYYRNILLFIAAGLVFLLLGSLATSIQAPIEPRDLQVLDSPFTEPLLVLIVGGLQAAVVFLIVEGYVTVVLGEMDAGRSPAVGTAFSVVIRRAPTLAGARLRASFHVILLLVTVLGMPWAVNRSVSWLFTEQMVLLEDYKGKEVLSASADLVRGSWRRTVGFVIAIVIVLALPAALIGIGFLLLASPPVSDSVYLLNGLLFGLVLFPIVSIMKVLLYFDLKARKNPDGPPGNA